MRSLLATILLLIPGGVMAQESEYAKAEFRDGKEVLLYRSLEPLRIEKGEKYPLVLFLHGAGERGSDNQAQLVHGGMLFLDRTNRDRFPAFVVFPQCPKEQRWVDIDWNVKKTPIQPREPSASLRLARLLVDRLLKAQPIDEKRIYVMGLSMGGFGAWDFAARYPELTTAIVPICGGADTSTAPRIKDIPVWAFHGARDTAVLPEHSRNMVEALRKAGAMPRYTEYKTVGHNPWDPAFREPELLPWLFSQKKP